MALRRSYDEFDTSPEALGRAFGDNEASTGGGGGGRAGGRGGGGSGGGRNDPWDGVDRSRFHVHFGAGRLGLGLVVGAIAKSNTPYSIVQRPKQSWSEITSQVSRLLSGNAYSRRRLSGGGATGGLSPGSMRHTVKPCPGFRCLAFFSRPHQFFLFSSS